MTAVAKLPGIIGSMLNFADVADRCELTEGNAPAAIRAWANQLAALSPAELGGVEWPREAKPAIDGDGYVAITRLAEHRMDEMQARVWNSCRAACIAAHRNATPRAAEAVTEEAVYTEEEVAEAMEVLRGRHGSSALVDEVLADMERVLRSALTPPSAKGE